MSDFIKYFLILSFLFFLGFHYYIIIRIIIRIFLFYIVSYIEPHGKFQTLSSAPQTPPAQTPLKRAITYSWGHMSER